MWKSLMTGNITSGLSEPPVQRWYMRDSISGVSGLSLTRGICITKCVPCLRKQSSKIIDFYNSIQRKSSKNEHPCDRKDRVLDIMSHGGTGGTVA